jgi:serine/threonine-protein kinase SRPK3
MSSSSNFINYQADLDWTGQILHKKYILIKKLGSGSFASVWMALNKTNKTIVAIKIHNTEDSKAASIEVALLEKFKKLKCNTCVSMLDKFSCETISDSDNSDNSDDSENTSDDTHFCVVMELMACSLCDLIKNGTYAAGLPFDFIRNVTLQVTQAIDALHNAGYIHTDIKPENILLCGATIENELIIQQILSPKFNQAVTKNKKKHSSDALKITINDILQQINLAKPNKNSNISSKSNSSDSNIPKKSNKSQYKFNKEALKSDSDNKPKQQDTIYDANYCIVDKKYIDQCKIKLSDFGTCILNSTKNKYSIQTRYYRAPEIIFKAPYNQVCDMWSLGCTIYELLTGDMLFNPKETMANNEDRVHLYDMQMKLGKISNNVLVNAQKRDVFFKKNGMLKGFNIIKFNLLKDSLHQIMINKNLTIDAFQTLSDFILQCFDFDINTRLNTSNALKHPFLTSLN